MGRRCTFSRARHMSAIRHSALSKRKSFSDGEKITKVCGSRSSISARGGAAVSGVINLEYRSARPLTSPTKEGRDRRGKLPEKLSPVDTRRAQTQLADAQQRTSFQKPARSEGRICPIFTERFLFISGFLLCGRSLLHFPSFAIHMESRRRCRPSESSG
ncbi:hypothetical protein SCHPADRAFT_583019 [Schizopora paradoxa]|uniref:Uncharacterized protein n=1 Tax=Schizopora paradoxa TaxID=27342 RepID=A0A0H2RB72_9AGAM|nr:hypothetical protein SCHPADRAFT_583019 [Schizopora paradoxa]